MKAVHKTLVIVPSKEYNSVEELLDHVEKISFFECSDCKTRFKSELAANVCCYDGLEEQE
jgi:hypothetical protein